MLKKILSISFLLSGSVFATKPTLTVYTYNSFASEWGPGPEIKKKFEAQCGCELKFIALEDSISLLNRLRMEGENSKADVVLGLDKSLLQTAKQSGLFTPSDIDITNLTLPDKWNDSIFIPYDYGYFSFVYDKKKLKNPPKSFQELLNSKQKWRVIYEDPRTSTPGFGLLLWMQKIYGENSPQAWQKLAKKTITVTKGWSEAYSLFLKGECDLVLSYSTSPAFHLIVEKKDHYAAVNFPEGHYLQIEVAAQLKSSTQPMLAHQFMKFIISEPFQKTIPTGHWMYPVINITLPNNFNRLPVPKPGPEFTPEQVAQKRATWIRIWQRAVSH